MLFLCLNAFEKQGFVIQVGTQKIRLLFNSHFLSLHLKIISWFCSFINPPRYLFKYSWKPDPCSLCLSPYKFKEFQSHSHLPDTRSKVYWRGQASVPCHCWWQVFCHRPTACRRHPAQSTSTTSTQLEHYWGRIFPGQFQKPQIFWFSTFPVRKARERSGFSLYSPITLPDLWGSRRIQVSMTFSVLVFSPETAKQEFRCQAPPDKNQDQELNHVL